MRIVCPTCRKVLEDAPPDHPSRPFCSPRCKLVDLDNWLNEAYRIPGPPTDRGDEESDQDERPNRDRG